MADAATFVLSLVDKVTGPAKRQAKALDALQAQIKRTGKVGAMHHARTDGLIGPLSPKQLARQNRANLLMLAGAKASGVANKSLDKVADTAVTATKWTALGAAAIGGALGAAIVKNTVQMALFQDTSMTAFRSLTGSVAGGQKAWESSLGLARELGMGVEDTVGSMKHLLAMQFTLPQAEEMVRMSADLKAVTGDAHSAERALTAITQIKAKGKLQAEELVGQLAEAGVSTTLVYEELKKSMNLKSTADVQRAITAGSVTSDIGIAAIKAAIGHKTHSSRTGEAGQRFAQTTYSGLIAQLQNAPQFLFVRLGQAVAGNIEKLRPVVQRVIDAIDNIQGDQMAKFVGNTLDFMAKLVPLTLEFAKGFGEGFSAINAAMGAVDPSKASMETAKELGYAMAKAFEMAFKAIKLVADTILWLDQHRGVAAAVAGMLAIDKVAGAGATAKGLIGAGKWAVGSLAGGAAAGGATAGGGLSGAAALAAGVGTAGLAAGGAALAGVGAAGLSWAYREELAKWMYGIGDSSGERGLGPATPTPLLAGMQGATNRATTNNVKMESNITITGAEDPAAVGKQVSDAQRGQLEQFFQGQALEAGAM